MDINKFCGTRGHSSLFHAPMNFKDKTIATNGIVFLRQPRLAGEREDWPADRSNKVIALLEQIESATYAPEQIPPLPEMVLCATCIGCGKATKTECPECGGIGVVDAETDYSTYRDLECASCRGMGHTAEPGGGQQDCPDCSGSGRVCPSSSYLAICGVMIDLKYFNLIMGFDDLQFAASEDKQMLMFRSGIMAGAIMGCRV